MSILIKGMEMPTDGTVFVIDSAGQVWSNEWPTRGYARLDGVTVVPVPAHGDLIDRDALMVDLMDRGIEGIQTDDWHEIQQTVADAPTIIQAEE
jgi:hypothetical protein